MATTPSTRTPTSSPSDDTEPSNGSDLVFMNDYSKRTREVAVCGREFTFRQGRIDGELSGLVWPSALIASHLLAERIVDVQALHVVELGAGCGLVSLVASAMGAASVLATETEDGLESTAACIRDARNATDGVAVELSVCDWTDTTLSLETADIVVVSDCIHLAPLHAPLAALLGTISDSATVLLTSQVRRPLREQAFFAALPSHNLQASHLSLDSIEAPLRTCLAPPQLQFLYAVRIVKCSSASVFLPQKLTALKPAFPKVLPKQEESEPDSVFL